MARAQRKEDGSASRSVLVSNTAVNMISSLHPSNQARAKATLKTIMSSVLNPEKVTKIVGVDNAFVASAGDLRVVFKKDGDFFVITSVVAKA
jgi:hypothetical protein